MAGTQTQPAVETREGDDAVSLSQHGKMVPYAGGSADAARESLLGDLIRYQTGGDLNCLRQAVIKHRTTYADACNTEYGVLLGELEAFVKSNE